MLTLKRLEGVVSDRILDAARTASRALDKAGVRHVLIGGLAVGVYGYVRATKDVDFLVGEEGFDRHAGGILTFKPGVPIAVGDVAIDTMLDEAAEDQLDDPEKADGIPVINVEALVYLKLRAHRRRDQQDIVELLRAGIDENVVRAYVEEVAPELVERFNALVELSDEEE